MYKPNKNRKKECCILISRSAGHDIVFVKTLMEMFLKPMMDSVLNSPEIDPIDSFTTKPQDKTVGKENVTVKQEPKEENVKCEHCYRIFMNNIGLSIHIGKMHKEKRKRSDMEESESIFSCPPCGFECKTKIALSYHHGSCAKRQKELHDSRRLTPANKKTMRKTEDSQENDIEIHVPRATKTIVEDEECELRQKENIMEIDDKNRCDQCHFNSTEPYVLKQHKRDKHRELSVSVTPPPKKRMEQEKDLEREVEEVLKQMIQALCLASLCWTSSFD